MVMMHGLKIWMIKEINMNKNYDGCISYVDFRIEWEKIRKKLLPYKKELDKIKFATYCENKERITK